MYEALFSILLDQMEEIYENDSLKYIFMQDAKVKIKDFCFELNNATYNMHQDSEGFKSYLKLFIYYNLELQKTCGDLTKFGLSFLEIVELLLNVLYATIAGHWNLYLVCIHEIIPYTFAYDHLMRIFNTNARRNAKFRN